MSGNLSEFCFDWLSDDYYFNSPEFNPTGPKDGTYKVVRDRDYLNSSRVIFGRSGIVGGSAGFRVAFNK